LGDIINIQIQAADTPGTGIYGVFLYDGTTNHTLSSIDDSIYTFSWQPPSLGLHYYQIYLQDNANNWNATPLYNLTIKDSRPPSCLVINQYPSIAHIGDTIILQVAVTDSGGTGINQVLLEYNGQNHSMIHTTSNYYIWDSWDLARLDAISFRIFMQDCNGNWGSTPIQYLNIKSFPSDNNTLWLIIGLIIGGIIASISLVLLRNRWKKPPEPAPSKLNAGKAFLMDPLKKLEEMKQDWRGFLRKYLDPASKSITLPLRSQLSPETIQVLQEEQDKAILEATKAIEAEDIQAAIGYLERAAKFAQDLGQEEQARQVLVKIKEMKIILSHFKN